MWDYKVLSIRKCISFFRRNVRESVLVVLGEGSDGVFYFLLVFVCEVVYWKL